MIACNNEEFVYEQNSKSIIRHVMYVYIQLVLYMYVPVSGEALGSVYTIIRRCRRSHCCTI